MLLFLEKLRRRKEMDVRKRLKVKKKKLGKWGK
jgi:hypothetical protein